MASVLIVEDEDQVRVLAKSYLREQGHQTVSAATAEEVLAVFEVVERIDVLFTDINLRGDVRGRETGYDSASRISPCSTPPARRSPTACGR